MNYERINKQFDVRGKNPDMSKILSGDVSEITATLAYPITRRMQAKRARVRLLKMLQQGDIEAADLIEYYKTANKLQRSVILSVLDAAGYSVSDAKDELRARQARNSASKKRTIRDRRKYDQEIM